MRSRAACAFLGAAAVLAAGLVIAADEYGITEIKKAEYRVGVKHRAEIAVGSRAYARLYVVAGSGWKVNVKFPFKVDVTAPAGVALEKSSLKKDDAKVLDDHKAVFKIPYTVSAAGSHELKAKVKLSVCQGTTQCLFPTETVEWTVSAKGE